jgi:hypothetical protein
MDRYDLEAFMVCRNKEVGEGLKSPDLYEELPLVLSIEFVSKDQMKT